MISAYSLLGKIVIAILIMSLLWIWFGTGYKIEDAKIKIKFGPCRWSIRIEDIRRINKVRNPFTAPALSVDRYKILYGNYDVISISPRNECEFIRLLINKNPKIEIDDGDFFTCK